MGNAADAFQRRRRKKRKGDCCRIASEERQPSKKERPKEKASEKLQRAPVKKEVAGSCAVSCWHANRSGETTGVVAGGS